jgi:hypothetical protein
MGDAPAKQRNGNSDYNVMPSIEQATTVSTRDQETAIEEGSSGQEFMPLATRDQETTIKEALYTEDLYRGDQQTAINNAPVGSEHIALPKSATDQTPTREPPAVQSVPEEDQESDTPVLAGRQQNAREEASSSELPSRDRRTAMGDAPARSKREASLIPVDQTPTREPPAVQSIPDEDQGSDPPVIAGDQQNAREEASSSKIPSMDQRTAMGDAPAARKRKASLIQVHQAIQSIPEEYQQDETSDAPNSQAVKTSSVDSTGGTSPKQGRDRQTALGEAPGFSTRDVRDDELDRIPKLRRTDSGAMIPEHVVDETLRRNYREYLRREWPVSDIRRYGVVEPKPQAMPENEEARKQ